MKIIDRILIILGSFIAVVLALGLYVAYGGGAGTVHTAFSIIVGLAAICLAVVIYLFPSLAARQRHVPNIGSVIVVNLLLGWTVVGWIVALAMAMRDPRGPQAAH